jgi:hypothetical protein
MVGAPFQGWCPASEVNDGGCPGKPDHLNPWTLLGDIARTSVACIALALAFAGLARRPGSDLSLLGELHLAWLRLHHSRIHLRRRSGSGSADEAYFQRLSQLAEAEENESGGRS